MALNFDKSLAWLKAMDRLFPATTQAFTEESRTYPKLLLLLLSERLTETQKKWQEMPSDKRIMHIKPNGG